MQALLAKLMLRVDILPAALEGNAFFGQWTYGGKGMTWQPVLIITQNVAS